MALSLDRHAYLEAVYFPKPPDFEGMTIGQDDPTWLKICGWLGEWESDISSSSKCTLGGKCFFKRLHPFIPPT